MLGSGSSLQAAFWYQKAMLALLPRGGESLTPRQQAGFKYGNPQNRIHLTEKPLQLMQDLVKITEPGGHILDPFAGSGTTVLAAVKEGYDATGIEVTDVYADLARKRLESELDAA